MNTTKSYTSTKPGAVSANLFRLREEAGMSRKEIYEATGVARATTEKFEKKFEPPTNHPLLLKIATALSKRLGRDITNELMKGGSSVTLSARQLARSYIGHKDIAPKTFNAKARNAGLGGRGRNRYYGRMLDLYDNDPRIATLVKKHGMPLPHAKENRHGEALGQNPRAVRERAYRITRMLREEGVDIAALLNGAGNPTPASQHTPVTNGNGNGRRPGKDLRNVVYTAVTTFNSRRMQGERTMVMPMNAFETMFVDYLKQSGISSNVLVGEDIAKLVPKE